MSRFLLPYRALVKLSTAAALLSMMLCGCSSTRLPSARRAFYAGDMARAEEELTDLRPGDPPHDDDILILFERGTILRKQGRYTESNDNLITAAELMKQLETWRLSEGAASMVINDNVQTYEGAYYEKIFMHVLTSLNHSAMGNWEHMAVEARRMLEKLNEEYREEYPDIAIARYMAGLAFQLTRDPSNAAMQFRLADELTPSVKIDEFGRVGPETEELSPGEVLPHECIGLIGMGRSPSGEEVIRGHLSMSSTNTFLQFLNAEGDVTGRSYLITDVWDSARRTETIDAPKRALKTATRIAAKEAIAISMEGSGEVEAEIAATLWRIIMLGIFETPDFRRWETLPGTFHIARFTTPEPPDKIRYRIVSGEIPLTDTITVTNAPASNLSRTTLFTFRLLP